MVFLGLEQPVEQQGYRIFDPTMAKMVLDALDQYMNVLRDDYLRGREDLKEFNTKFGDFISPIQKDMEWYDQNVTGATRDFINLLYAASGGDPLRTAEGRAMISRFINNMPTGKINMLRLSAETAKEYLKNAGALNAEGRYNKDAELFFGRDLSAWNTLGGNGIWNASSPIKNQTMDELIEPIIANLDYTYDEARTKEANDGNDYYTVSEDRIRATINDAIEDLTRNGTMGGYYYNKALLAAGNDAKAALDLYKEWLVNRGRDHLKEKFTPNEWKMMAKKHQYELDLINARARADRSGNGGGGGDDGGSATYDWASDIYDTGLNNIMGLPVGQQYQLGPGNWVGAKEYYQGGEELVNAQCEFGKNVAKKYNVSDYGARSNAYRSHFTHTKGISGATFAEYLGRPVHKETANNKINWNGLSVVRVEDSDIRRMRTIDQMITNTAGYSAKYRPGNTDLIDEMKKNPQKYLIGGGNIDIYGAFDKPGRYRNDFIVDVYDRDSGKKLGQVAYDSYINSERTSSGFYQRVANTKANTSRDLKTRQSVTEGSRRVNKSLSLTNKEKMADILPYVGD